MSYYHSMQPCCDVLPKLYCWKAVTASEIPNVGFRGGTDVDGSHIYVGRMKRRHGDLLPGSVVPSRNIIRTPYGGREYTNPHKFEVLVPNSSSFEWVPSRSGEILPDMVVGGVTDRDENLYIGRVHHKASQIVGKIHPSHRVCYIPFDGKEIMYQLYEALVLKPYHWVDSSPCGTLPTTAVDGGLDNNLDDIYVGKACHDGNWIPAKVIPCRKVAYVPYNGRAFAKYRYKVLCEGLEGMSQLRFHWVCTTDGKIPAGAIEGGRTSYGQVLYIGRVYHKGFNAVGKVNPSHGVCYIPFKRKEIPYRQYEILVLKR